MFQARLNLYAGPGCLAWLAEAAGSSRIMVVTDAGCDRAGILDHVLTALFPVRPVGVCDSWRPSRRSPTSAAYARPSPPTGPAAWSR